MLQQLGKYLEDVGFYLPTHMSGLLLPSEALKQEWEA